MNQLWITRMSVCPLVGPWIGWIFEHFQKTFKRFFVHAYVFESQFCNSKDDFRNQEFKLRNSNWKIFLLQNVFYFLIPKSSWKWFWTWHSVLCLPRCIFDPDFAKLSPMSSFSWAEMVFIVDFPYPQMHYESWPFRVDLFYMALSFRKDKTKI